MEADSQTNWPLSQFSISVNLVVQIELELSQNPSVKKTNFFTQNPGIYNATSVAVDSHNHQIKVYQTSLHIS